jgi:predicted methyltransferase
MDKQYDIYFGDAMTLFQNIKDESIDCIVTDPPYEVISGGAQENEYVARPTGILAKNDGKIF